MNPKSRRPAHEILSRAFDRVMRKNPSYSLRALAKALEISPSYLSRVFNGKKPIPEARFDDLVVALGMDESSRRVLREAMLRESLKGRKASTATLEDILASKMGYTPSRASDYHEGALPEFSIFDPWYRMAILDLVTCADFNSSAKWVSERLGISAAQANESLQALIAAGLLREEEGRYFKVDEKIRFPTTRSHPSIRRYHKRMIEEAIRVLVNETDDSAFNRRLITAISFAANPANLPKAKERLAAALFEVADILLEGECTEVYQLNAQLFQLTRQR